MSARVALIKLRYQFRIPSEAGGPDGVNVRFAESALGTESGGKEYSGQACWV